MSAGVFLGGTLILCSAGKGVQGFLYALILPVNVFFGLRGAILQCFLCRFCFGALTSLPVRYIITVQRVSVAQLDRAFAS